MPAQCNARRLRLCRCVVEQCYQAVMESAGRLFGGLTVA